MSQALYEAPLETRACQCMHNDREPPVHRGGDDCDPRIHGFPLSRSLPPGKRGNDDAETAGTAKAGGTPAFVGTRRSLEARPAVPCLVGPRQNLVGRPCTPSLDNNMFDPMIGTRLDGALTA